MAILEKQFKHVSFLWDEQKANSLGDDEVALLIYRSNILGADLRITNYGGGNTSCKTYEKDPLSGNEVEVMWVKGSGGDIGTLTKSGLAGLYVDKLRALEGIYKGIEFEDEMVGLFNHCIYDLDSKAPSIDTPLHAFLPFKHIDHLHPDAAIAIAASKDGEKITQELFDGQIAWIPWQRPGFDLGLQLKKALDENPGIRGIMLGGHGLFTWGDTAYECYINSLEVIEKASQYLEDNYGKTRPVFGGQKIDSLSPEQRKDQAAIISPLLRGLASSYDRMVGTFNDSEVVLQFINSNDLDKLAPLGTSCPDHFLRTKIAPLVLDIPADQDLSDLQAIKDHISKLFETYRKGYKDYYEKHKRSNSPAMRDPNPVIILWPGVGLFSYAKNKQTSRVASEFYINAINVMRGAEAVSSYVSLPLQEAFDIEYWLLEEAKLQRMPKEQPLSRKVALITGSAGGIGKAIADKLAKEGACVILTDIDQGRLEEAVKDFGKDTAIQSTLNVLDNETIVSAFKAANLAFGGVDIVVNCAGLAISKPLNETSEADWDLLHDVLVKGQFKVSQEGVKILRAQGLGGDIINIASKNALVSGPNNVGYGTAKAAQVHMSRLLAAELGPDKIRVNVVNPDAVIEGSKIWEGKWAEGRAKAYGIKVEELPAHYAKRTLMNEIISTEDIANGVFAFVGGVLSKSTGNILNVDGGVAAAFVR
ncbi:bifunctional aldolase/short-chain dehydrogenase [Belliella kenyensis]|uniref:Bifunctional aldolase/short-chain dehydrogenase n=1 Tax=Belliella kenyensis TaxID=1472724 RepID=A0ABV8EFM3_9BACT|nr:bifunctional aldolase/short-chain dehydrogenase [Belliella kenyensis]MCH7401846.1 bifunctional aldolase/short-chain dehydrogenase [Belliella kenyensis]MDN3604346.1 bifunctional aldolase/short-chain dehydrogenase [Belliella kenyensis]